MRKVWLASIVLALPAAACGSDHSVHSESSNEHGSGSMQQVTSSEERGGPG